MIRTGLCCALLVLLGLIGVHAETLTWTLHNYGAAYKDELLRLKVTPTAPYDADTVVVKEDGVEVPCQVEVLEGTRQAVSRANLWVCTSVAANGTHAYEVSTGGTPAVAAPRVKVTQADGAYELDNGVVAVKVPAAAGAGIPGPILGIRAARGAAWLGTSQWSTKLALAKFEATLVDDGKLFAKVRLRYDFTPVAGVNAPFAEVTIRLAPGQPAATIEESHQMQQGDAWRFDPNAGWTPAAGLMRGWRRWEPNPAPPVRPAGVPAPVKPPVVKPTTVADETLRLVEFAPSARLGDTLCYLEPRWTQNVDMGWFFGVSDGTPVRDAKTQAITALNGATTMVGVVPIRASKWDWPYDNLIEVRLVGQSTSFVCPTTHGRRCFLLMAGPRTLADSVNQVVANIAVIALDRVVNDMALGWPGKDTVFAPRFPFDTASADPNGALRLTGNNLLFALKYGTAPRLTETLQSTMLGILDPDFFGYGYNHWSAGQTSYMADLLRIPIVQCVAMKGHPDFPIYAKMVEDAFRMMVDSSVTLPGGAGQDCPGYLYRELTTWLDLADICRDQLGFNPYEWPRIKAAASFLLHSSAPFAGGRRLLPQGETSWPGPALADLQQLCTRVGLTEDVAALKTEELPGYGVVFHAKPGATDETYLAFKAGPNRGRAHGDQLSIHFIGAPLERIPNTNQYRPMSRRLAVDHMTGTMPRPMQEHMHNRVAFTPKAPGWNFANMDGYERLIAYKSTDTVDVAIGQVESQQLRKVPASPEDVIWQAPTEVMKLDTPLVYRRTIVFVKSGGTPYVVIRDQHWGPDVKATFCLHLDNPLDVARKGSTIDTGRLSVFVAQPATFDMERLGWTNVQGGGGVGLGATGLTEKTVNLRLSTSGEKTEFITVLYPGQAANIPAMVAVPGGVRLMRAGGTIETITFADPADNKAAPVVTFTRANKPEVLLTAGDVDLNRSQGDVSLLTTEPGFDYGPIPDWLIKQRTTPERKETWDR